MKKTKKMIEQSIMLAIDSLSEDLQKTALAEEQKPIAESIKALAEAYDIVHRGKKGDC